MESNLRTFLRKAGSVGLDQLGVKGQLIKAAINTALPAEKQVSDTGTADDLRQALDSLPVEVTRLVTKQLNQEPEIKAINKQETKESIEQIITSVALTLIDKNGGFKNPIVLAVTAVVMVVLGYFGIT